VAAEHELGEDQLPINALGEGSDVVRQVMQSGRPRVVTENGTQVAVILDIEAYRELQQERGASALRDTLLAASAEVDRGDVVEDAEVRARLSGRFSGRLSPELLKELVRE
jgi:prevent-host-death family protein